MSEHPEAASPTARCVPPYQGYAPILDAAGMATLLYLASGREVLKLARQQVIPSVKLGKRVLFITEDVIEALRRRSRPALTDEDLT